MRGVLPWYRSVTALLFSAVALLPSHPLGAQSTANPVTPLPPPSGSLPVGTTVADLVDTARRSSQFPDGRPITVQFWYPAQAGSGPAAPYLFEPNLAAVITGAGYYEVDTSTVRAWTELDTHARRDAPPMSGRHPVVTFSVGLGVLRANYTSLATDLASHGYIVALVDSPLEGLMVLPSGRVISDTGGTTNSPAGHRAAVNDWARDVSLVLDRVQTAALPAPAARVAATADFARVAAAGHSSGGLVAITACEVDRRVRACIDLDGGFTEPTGEPIADFVPRGVSAPTLLLRSHPLYGPADFARRGITREEWEKRGEAGHRALDSLAARSPAFWRGEVAGTGHFNFSDAPFVMPGTITRFGGKIIAPQRSLLVIGGAIRAFLRQELDGVSGALVAAARRYPELTVTPPQAGATAAQ